MDQGIVTDEITVLFQTFVPEAKRGSRCPGESLEVSGCFRRRVYGTSNRTIPNSIFMLDPLKWPGKAPIIRRPDSPAE
jgi:hypothetical protein